MLASSGIDLELTTKAIDRIADLGYDPEFGARPVKRVIQRYVLNQLSREILAGTVERGSKIYVDFDGNDLTFTNK